MWSRDEVRLRALSRRRLLAWLGGAALFAGARPTPAAAAEDPGLPPAVMPGLFGSIETAVGDPQLYVPKSRVLDRALAGEVFPLLEAAADGAQFLWQALLAELSMRPAEARIVGVDRFVNAFDWVDNVYRVLSK